MVKDIKAAIHAPLPPHDLTVIQTLYDHYRADVFNADAAEARPNAREKLDKAVRDLAVARGATRREARRLADHAWKWDHATDRRFRRGSAAPYKGRPEVYDPDVVWIFAKTITRVAERERFMLGHHGDKAITKKSNEGGPMFRVLVASVEWALIESWRIAATPGTRAPQVKPEGLLTVLKRLLKKRTD
jgi:hypothetical protein